MQNIDFELCVDVTLEKLVTRGPKGQSESDFANLSGKRTEEISLVGCTLVSLCSLSTSPERPLAGPVCYFKEEKKC